ncbi:MAG TPA: MmcQ/YjbR family DNA-binding protein [Rhizomicrobium sp.]
MAKAKDVRKIALALAGVEEKGHFGSPSFRAQGRIFAQTDEEANEAIFKLSPLHQEVLFETRPDAFRPEIWGAIRWTRVLLDGIAGDELQALVREAYDQVTGAKPKKPSTAAKPRR